MIEKVKIEITEEEWADTPDHVRSRVLEKMKEYGYDTKMLEALEREIAEPTSNDVYRQFYGDEE